MWKLLKRLYAKPRETEKQLTIPRLNAEINVTNNHLIALARLLFIKPETLYREANNIKANGEYLLQLLQEQQKTVNPEGKHEN